MKFRELKRKAFESTTYWKGSKKGYKITIAFSESTVFSPKSGYYYLIHKEDIDFRFNSLWKFKEFKTFEECCKQAEEYLDKEVLKLTPKEGNK